MNCNNIKYNCYCLMLILICFVQISLNAQCKEGTSLSIPLKITSFNAPVKLKTVKIIKSTDVLLTVQVFYELKRKGNYTIFGTAQNKTNLGAIGSEDIKVAQKSLNSNATSVKLSFRLTKDKSVNKTTNTLSFNICDTEGAFCNEKSVTGGSAYHLPCIKKWSNKDKIDVIPDDKVMSLVPMGKAYHIKQTNRRLTPYQANGWSAVKETEKQPQGPASDYLNLFKEIDINSAVNINSIFGIWNRIYPDVNQKSGYYYYLPSHYGITYDREQKTFSIVNQYNGDDAKQTNTFAVALHPYFSKETIKIAKELLAVQLKGTERAQYGINELVPMSLEKGPEIPIPNLSVTGLEKEQVGVSISEDMEQPINILFPSDDTESIIGLLLNRISLDWDIIYTPKKGEGTLQNPIQRTAQLKIADPLTYGPLEIDPKKWRNSGITNHFLYPLELKNLNILRREKDHTFRVFSWKIKNGELAPGQKTKFRGVVPDWIDQDRSILKMWLDYDVKECTRCDTKVIESVTGGSFAQCDQKMNLDLKVFALDKSIQPIKEMIIQLRSTQFGGAINQKERRLDPITVAGMGGMSNKKVGELCVTEGDEPSFEYKLIIWDEQENEYRNDEWVRVNDAFLRLGKTAILSLYPSLAIEKND